MKQIFLVEDDRAIAKNLMLLLHSEGFAVTHASMTEKVIKDGSETRRARYNMVCSIIGSFLILIGIVLLLVKGMSVEYIDGQGILHENFFLIPIGFLCVFSGLISFITVGITTLISKLKNRNS